jgi:hypothetical protein
MAEVQPSETTEPQPAPSAPVTQSEAAQELSKANYTVTELLALIKDKEALLRNLYIKVAVMCREGGIHIPANEVTDVGFRVMMAAFMLKYAKRKSTDRHKPNEGIAPPQSDVDKAAALIEKQEADSSDVGAVLSTNEQEQILAQPLGTTVTEQPQQQAVPDGDVTMSEQQ